MINRDVFKRGHLTVRPGSKAVADDFATGVQPLNVGERRDGLIYVPQGYHKNKPAALAVMLHGAGGEAAHGLHLLQPYADDRNMILIAPASREKTWDIIAKDGFDADVISIDQALSLVFASYAINTAHMAIGGFSDGASYALSLGLGNGNLFTHIIAFSPGFYYTPEHQGKPPVFISHGVQDRILPIDPCSRKIVPRLVRSGYEVNYQEFDGGHLIPAHIAAAAMDWFLNP